jgi:F-type H+-transporting ATPase subunit b
MITLAPYPKLQAVLLAALAVVLPALLLSPMAQAAEEGHGGGGLPQLDPSYWPSQIFWFLLSFGLLYLLVSRVVLPPLSGTLEKRQSLIDTDLAEAGRLAESAKATRAAYEDALAKARNEANATVNAIVAAAGQEAAAQQATQHAALKARLTEAETKIRAARTHAMGEVQQAARDLAHIVVDKAAGIKLGGGQ